MSILKKKKDRGQVLLCKPNGIHWDVEDPFTFVSHHEDDYPSGTKQQAPPLEEIAGRDLGRDYEKRFGFRMYHGKVVPGFPAHAHWGYDILTITDIGYIDHFDNMGNQGRYGFGDIQWVTAGGMYQHSEMYPLVSPDSRNPNDITQIMINLPLEMKNCGVSVNTIWSENVPCLEGDGYRVKIITGELEGKRSLAPNNNSWAHDECNHVRILRIELKPDIEFTIPSVSNTINRNLYGVSGSKISFGDSVFDCNMRFKLPGNEDVTLRNGDSDAVMWLLEGEPIRERQVSFGPVILGNDKEVRDAMDEIRRTQYDEWPWDVIDKVQPRDSDRFIRYPDGREERPPGSH